MGNTSSTKTAPVPSPTIPLILVGDSDEGLDAHAPSPEHVEPVEDGPLRAHRHADPAGRLRHRGGVAREAHRRIAGRHRQYGR